MRRAIPLLAAAISLAAGPALAHPGHGGGLGAGFVHPFTGLDHLLAMAGVGLWAGLALRHAWWTWPASFVGAMLAGFLAGLGGAALPGFEGLIAASVIALGLAAALRLRAPVFVGAAAVAAFGFAHGFAHGHELPVQADLGGFAAGFVLATGMLHVAGAALAWGFRRSNADALARAVGLGAAAAGVALAWQG